MEMIEGRFGAMAEKLIRLPERLDRRDVIVVAGSDVVAGLVMILIAELVGASRAAALSVTVALTVSLLLGRYRLTYAAAPVDERYMVATSAIVAAVLLAILTPMFEVSWFAVAMSLLGWSLAAASAAQTLTAQRRGTQSEVLTSLYTVPPHARAKLRNEVLRGVLGLLDIALAFVASVVLLPVMIWCALAVQFSDRGPVFFRQDRVGIDGRSFTMFKFRTMTVDAGDTWAKPADTRITRAGRWLRRTSLDELPQLWNVLRGEMSLVGPRPEMPAYADRFARSIPGYNERHSVKPGITGWAQIHYKRNFQPDAADEVTRYDLFYIANYSVPLYLYCLVKTACEVFGHAAV